VASVIANDVVHLLATAVAVIAAGAAGQELRDARRSASLTSALPASAVGERVDDPSGSAPQPVGVNARVLPHGDTWRTRG
jgi:hypothetical protein